jgi:methanogenic corrinoid protein MtbC1
VTDIGTTPASRRIEWSGERMASLVRTIEGEIIPRLMLAHRFAPERSLFPETQGRSPGVEDVAELSRLVLAHEADVAASFVAAMRAQGMPLETIFLELLTPTARRLGELWEADLCDFTQVTVGLWRLQQVLRELGPAFEHEGQALGERREHGRRVLLVAAGSEQHVLGLAMVEEFLRRAGWEVCQWPCAPSDELDDLVRGEWFDLIGFSLSCESRLDVLKAAIGSLRRASCNPTVRVMVGGRVFAEHPELAAAVGADATAADARAATVQAQTLLEAVSKRC